MITEHDLQEIKSFSEPLQEWLRSKGLGTEVYVAVDVETSEVGLRVATVEVDDD